MKKILHFLFALLTVLPVIAQKQTWGGINHKGQPWVTNISQPNQVTKGLYNRHVSLWASHGYYYDIAKGYWKWQRPKLFSTTEDLFTQTIVVPYLIPMLENAGAIVFTPRERDWQKHEVIIDNDNHPAGVSYLEVAGKYDWETTSMPGFALRKGSYSDGENPFIEGTARMAKTTSSKTNYTLASYQPRIPEEGRYAVYVSYQTYDNSIDNVHYIVWHKGEETHFHVNQQMGGNTWVYLGTFEFDQGSNEFNRVVVTNQSKKRGVVTTDAVRFGGGMGNIERGGIISGMPRCLEGARYTAQWSGMPYNVYSSKHGQDDYADDINVRSLMTNYMGGGSCYMPHQEGKRVPIELSLAVHSDAGYAENHQDLIGSLTICTTRFNNGLLDAGISREASRTFANMLLGNTQRDLSQVYGKWNAREVYDRNYSETRLPAVPSAILETMSHQNFPDMLYGQDPNFRFTLARSIYKTILRFISNMHGEGCVVQPLPPVDFKAVVNRRGEVKLSWQAVEDPHENSSTPTDYILYTAVGSGDFNNGELLGSASTHYSMKLEPGVLYSFRIAAVNKGGKSFPSEVMSAYYNPNAKQSVLIVNGFHRLSSPAVRNNIQEQGYDLQEDPGVSYGLTAGWSGQQTNFDLSGTGNEGETGLGYSGTEWAGHFMAGNDFNYVRTHADAIQSAQVYNISSCSSQAIESHSVKLSDYNMVDLILGLERYDGHSLQYYKAMGGAIQDVLTEYTKKKGRLLVSGAYIGSDMTREPEMAFLHRILKCQFGGTDPSVSETINGMGTTFEVYRQINDKHYAAVRSDILRPLTPAFTALQYPSGESACVAYQGKDYRTFTMAFPFECVKSVKKRHSMMRGILNFLLSK